MPLDSTKVGHMVAAQMEALEGRYGDDCQIGDVVTVVEVVGPQTWDVAVRCTDGRPHIRMGLLNFANAMLTGRLAGENVDDGD